MAKQKFKVLAIIPARLGSKRIPRKNIRPFFGKPLIAHTILQARSIPWIDRVIVDTESEEIAKIARRYGAEVPWLRPQELAQDTSKVYQSLIYHVKRLRKEEGYAPTHILLLQTTSPLREREDIERCWEDMKRGGATSVLTVCPTHPYMYHLGPKNELILANKKRASSMNTQAWPPAYILNGCFVYIIKTDALLREKAVHTKKMRAVVCDKWRSVDLDTLEDWAIAEIVYKHRGEMKRRLKELAKKRV